MIECYNVSEASQYYQSLIPKRLLLHIIWYVTLVGSSYLIKLVLNLALLSNTIMVDAL